MASGTQKHWLTNPAHRQGRDLTARNRQRTEAVVDLTERIGYEQRRGVVAMAAIELSLTRPKHPSRLLRAIQ
ncbi:MAG: hypothetical protein KGS61_05885 [Verrucomicrobia bacterium]|nr:hypothetical protein [Verrucomicrobiota bacterium]